LIAAGEPMALRQEDVAFRGHAIECRVTAEDPVSFMPSPGRVTAYVAPGGPGVRVDSHCLAGYTVPPHYDSLVAKVITHGADRAEALARMRRAMAEFIVEGIKTTIPLHARLLADSRFVSADYSTTFLESGL
jgi:acetyl-CoA carboxylase biotin carboxylase subunit